MYLPVLTTVTGYVGVWLRMRVMYTGTEVITLCNPTPYEVEAGVEGSIISPTVSQPRSINCKLKLTGLPKPSWFGLYVEVMELLCTFEYNCNSGRCSNYGISYIKVDGSSETMCSPDNNPLYYYTNLRGSVTINHYSDYYINSDDYFNLTYKVASVVDIGNSKPVHTFDTKGQSSGYVVSHPQYGREDYKPRRNSTLTLTKLRSDMINIRFIKLSLHSSWGNCYDYLLVIVNGRTEAKVCGNSQSMSKYKDKWVRFTAENNQIAFQFVTSKWNQRDGFMFEYTVAPLTRSPTTSTEERSTISTNHYTETVEHSTTSVGKQYTTYQGFSSTRSTETSTRSIEKRTTHTLGAITKDGVVHIATTVSNNHYGNQTDIFESEGANQLQTNPPPGGNSLYIGVGVGIGVLLLSIAILTVVLVKRRIFKRHLKAETENGSRFGNSRVSQAENNAYELPKMGNGDYSMVDEPVAGKPRVRQLPTSHGASRSNVYSTISRADERLKGAESQSGEQDYCLADEQEDTYYSSADRVEPDQEPEEGDNGDTDTDISTTYHLADDIKDEQNIDNSSPYCLAGDGTCDLVNNRSNSDALKEGVQGITPPTTTTGDTVYQLVEEEDEYVNAAAVMRQEAEVNIDDDYSPIVASTKSGKEVTELIENELYGT